MRPFVSHLILPLIVLHCGRWTLLFVPFSWEQIIVQTCVRCQERDARLWFVLVAGAEGHPGAGLRCGGGPAAGAGAGLDHQRGSLRYTAPLSGPGEDAMRRSKTALPHQLSCALPHPCWQGKLCQSGTEESGVLAEVQRLKDQLETSEEQREGLERQLSEASVAVARLQGEGTAVWCKSAHRPATLFFSFLFHFIK